MGQQDHLLDKGVYCQAWWPTFDPQVPHGRGTEWTESCHKLWHTHDHMHTHTQK